MDNLHDITSGESQEMTYIVGVHSLRIMNVCTEFCARSTLEKLRYS